MDKTKYDVLELFVHPGSYTSHNAPPNLQDMQMQGIM